MSYEPESYESNTRVFTVKIWLEESLGEGKAIWRGHIRDATSEKQFKPQYIENLFDIVLFIIPYLAKMGVKKSWFWQFVCWSRRKRKKQEVEISSKTSLDNEHQANS